MKPLSPHRILLAALAGVVAACASAGSADGGYLVLASDKFT